MDYFWCAFFIFATSNLSGITRMGLQIASDMGITLFSRAKGKHFLIYNGSENVEFDVDLPDKFEVANIKKAHQK